MSGTFVLTSNKSAVAPNKGVVIVNVHRDTRSAGDTDDTPIIEVVVTAVENWDISEESVRDLRENNPVSM